MALLQKFVTPFGNIRVTRDSDGTLAYYQNGCFHSQSTARGVSICVYVHVIFQIILQKKARKILIIGCGGGTLATMLARKNVHVTVVDINPVAFTIARDYFKMPADVVCVEHDGLAYVRNAKERFDTVVIDVFDSHNNVPDGFTTNEFLGTAKKKLKRGGALVMNVIKKNAKDKRVDVIAANVAAAGMPTHIYSWCNENTSNAIIIGGSVKDIDILSGRLPVAIRRDLKELDCRRAKK